jgi:hypothetical protein
MIYSVYELLLLSWTIWKQLISLLNDFFKKNGDWSQMKSWNIPLFFWEQNQLSTRYF